MILCCFSSCTIGSKPDQPLASEWKWLNKNDLRIDHRTKMAKIKDMLWCRRMSGSPLLRSVACILHGDTGWILLSEHCALIRLSLWSRSLASLWAAGRSGSIPRGSPSRWAAACRRPRRSSCCCLARTRGWACCRCSCRLTSGSPCDQKWRRGWCYHSGANSLQAFPRSLASSAACWGTRPASAWTSCDLGSCRWRTGRTPRGRTPAGRTPRSARSSTSSCGPALNGTRRAGWWSPVAQCAACGSVQ